MRLKLSKTTLLITLIIMILQSETLLAIEEGVIKCPSLLSQLLTTNQLGNDYKITTPELFDYTKALVHIQSAEQQKKSGKVTNETFAEFLQSNFGYKTTKTVKKHLTELFPVELTKENQIIIDNVQKMFSFGKSKLFDHALLDVMVQKRINNSEMWDKYIFNFNTLDMNNERKSVANLFLQGFKNILENIEEVEKRDSMEEFTKEIGLEIEDIADYKKWKEIFDTSDEKISLNSVLLYLDLNFNALKESSAQIISETKTGSLDEVKKIERELNPEVKDIEIFRGTTDLSTNVLNVTKKAFRALIPITKHTIVTVWQIIKNLYEEDHKLDAVDIRRGPFKSHYKKLLKNKSRVETTKWLKDIRDLISSDIFMKSKIFTPQDVVDFINLCTPAERSISFDFTNIKRKYSLVNLKGILIAPDYIGNYYRDGGFLIKEKSITFVNAIVLLMIEKLDHQSLHNIKLLDSVRDTLFVNNESEDSEYISRITARMDQAKMREQNVAKAKHNMKKGAQAIQKAASTLDGKTREVKDRMLEAKKGTLYLPDTPSKSSSLRPRQKTTQLQLSAPAPAPAKSTVEQKVWKAIFNLKSEDFEGRGEWLATILLNILKEEQNSTSNISEKVALSDLINFRFELTKDDFSHSITLKENTDDAFNFRLYFPNKKVPFTALSKNNSEIKLVHAIYLKVLDSLDPNTDVATIAFKKQLGLILKDMDGDKILIKEIHRKIKDKLNITELEKPEVYINIALD